MNDDELLHQLADALAPEPCAPPAAGLQALHQSINTATRNPRPQRRRLRWLIPVVASVSALGIGDLALAAAGTSLPRVVRTIAHELKLPVDSPALLDTRHRRDALRVALDRDDQAAIETQARQLRAEFARLHDGERDGITVDVDQLLAQADGRLDAAEDDATSRTPSSTTTSSTTTAADSKRHSDGTDQPTTDGQPEGSTTDVKASIPSSGADNIGTSPTESNTNSETTVDKTLSSTGPDPASNRRNGGDQKIDNTQPDPTP